MDYEEGWVNGDKEVMKNIRNISSGELTPGSLFLLVSCCSEFATGRL
ncbi:MULTISPECIES: hypothetical protein [Pantoea]|nr:MULTISPECIES: hypothetical protein [Pantoea]